MEQYHIINVCYRIINNFNECVVVYLLSVSCLGGFR